MTTPLTASLLRAATSTFEELTLLFAAPADVSTPSAAPSTVAAVRFDGPIPGRLAVGVSAPLLPVLATSMLGLDTPPAAPLQRDALGELANVICGNVVPSLTSDGAVFRLDAPSSWDGDAALAVLLAHAGERLAGEVRLTLDDGDAIARLFVREPGTGPAVT